MVRLNKSPQPKAIKTEKDYQEGENFKTLAADCHNKCYICEDNPTHINVEHIVPHRKNPDLKFDWYNLFIACGHCNNIKHTKYDNVLDPTKCDPEEHIALSIVMTGDIRDRVNVAALKFDNSTIETVELLHHVYNGGTTDMKEIECTNLRNKHLIPDIRLFLQYIHNYFAEPDEDYDILILDEISRSSKFAAFKRKIIRDHPQLSSQFADALI